MDLVIATLVGVVVGAVLASLLALYLVQKRVDRDLIERRLRAYRQYQEWIGDVTRVFDSGTTDERVLEQAWWNVESFCREFRLTAWLLEPAVQRELEGVVCELESELERARQNGGGSGRSAQLLTEKYHTLDRLFRRQTKSLAREFRRFRFFTTSPSTQVEDD